MKLCYTLHLLLSVSLASSGICGLVMPIPETEIGDGCYVNEGPKPYVDFVRLADAIYHAEGGRRARVPYGIISVKVRDAAHARQVCINSISNNWHRWNGVGDFIGFMSLRYCPVGEGNTNWRKNVRWFYRNPKSVKH